MTAYPTNPLVESATSIARTVMRCSPLQLLPRRPSLVSISYHGLSLPVKTGPSPFRLVPAADGPSLDPILRILCQSAAVGAGGEPGREIKVTVASRPRDALGRGGGRTREGAKAAAASSSWRRRAANTSSNSRRPSAFRLNRIDADHCRRRRRQYIS
jgi:hypothetical protein